MIGLGLQVGRGAGAAKPGCEGPSPPDRLIRVQAVAARLLDRPGSYIPITGRGKQCLLSASGRRPGSCWRRGLIAFERRSHIFNINHVWKQPHPALTVS